MMIEFGKSDYKEGGDFTIFSNGDAGKVRNVKVEIQKKGIDYQDETGNRPDYQVLYTDENGGTTNDGYYYLNEATHNSDYGTFEKAVEKQWKKLASIINVSGGDPTIKAESAKDMLDKMAKLAKTSVEGKVFNVFANYGTKSNPKKYIQVRTWVPFIEAVETADDVSKLKAGNLDQIERLIQGDSSTGGASAPSTEGWV